MSNILIIKHGSLGDITQISGVLKDIKLNHEDKKIFVLTTFPYAELLTKWMKFFPKENLLILKTEEFNENPSQIFHQVLNFLDLPIQDVKYNKINVGKYSQIDPEIKDKLYEYFKPHNQKLYKLLNRNFDW